MNIKDLILNLEKDGDAYYHIHRKECPNAPKSNYQRVEEIEHITPFEKDNCLSTEVNIKGCKICLDDNERKKVEENIKILLLK